MPRGVKFQAVGQLLLESRQGPALYTSNVNLPPDPTIPKTGSMSVVTNQGHEFTLTGATSSEYFVNFMVAVLEHSDFAMLRKK